MSLRRSPEVPALAAATLLSGCSALVFETLWFRQAGLLLGNALWSSSLVLASFMAGLAIGNGLGGRLAGRLKRPLAAYAGVELVVGVSGAALVSGLPLLTPLLLPALRAATDAPALLLLVRAGSAFLLLLVPATAMGLTLPVLVEALRRDDRRFAWTLGQVYGWNTAGAVAGALLGELVLISALGLRGAGLAAASLNLAAAGVALALERSGPARERAAPATPSRRAPLVSGPLLAAFLAGSLLLALEVVWFRLLLLTAVGTSLSFAVMLAVVLSGIAGGGLLGAWLARTTVAVARASSVVAFLAGTATVVTYALFPATLSRVGSGAVGSVGGSPPWRCRSCCPRVSSPASSFPAWARRCVTAGRARRWRRACSPSRTPSGRCSGPWRGDSSWSRTWASSARSTSSRSATRGSGSSRSPPRAALPAPVRSSSPRPPPLSSAWPSPRFPSA